MLALTGWSWLLAAADETVPSVWRWKLLLAKRSAREGCC
jgi:hypothetical protein